MDWSNKTVMVTGATAGIGAATALRFAEEGATLVITGRRKERLETMADVLTSAGAKKVYIHRFDIQKKEQIASVAKNITGDNLSIDVLVNNAGLSRNFSPLWEDNTDGWDDMIDTNIKGLLHMTRVLLPGMIEKNSGHIINIGSIAGHEAYPNGAVYCATKHAVKAITASLRMDLLKTNIRVSSIDPGLVETEFSEVRFYGDKERAENVYKGFRPLTAADIAESVFWSASMPEHVTIAEMLVLPTDQASATMVHKK